MTPVKSIRLFFQEGTSDKVYNATIYEDRGKYTVHVEWGRRGSALQEGNKAVRVTRAVADRAFDRVVREKRGKGYEEITTAVQPATVAPPVGAGSGSKAGGTRRAKVGHAAQLLTAIGHDEVERFLADDDVVAQQKLDGKRVLVTIANHVLIPTNRHGQPTQGVDAAIAGLGYLPDKTVVDGEVMGGEFWLFDVLAFAGDDIRARGYLERWQILDEEVEPALTGDVRILPLARGKRGKRALHDKLRRAGAEGLVFKQRDAPYASGRGSTQRKYKFVKSADVIIVENVGNAYRMAVYDGRRLFDVGNVFSGTTNASRLDLDSRLARGEAVVAEVRYLYATDEHQLFQPVFVGRRDDKQATECVRDQLVRTDRRVVL